MKKETIRKFEDFELHHKIIFFLLVMIATILITRGIVLIKNFNPTILGFQLHHFNYGLILLLITTLLLLFGKTRKHTYLILAAISTGLIIDDVWFIRKNVAENNAIQTPVYNATFPAAMILTVIIILIIFLITHFSRIRKRKGK